MHRGSLCELVTGPDAFLPVHLPVAQGLCPGGEHPQACIKATYEQLMLRGLGVGTCRLQGHVSLLWETWNCFYWKSLQLVKRTTNLIINSQIHWEAGPTLM